MKSKFIFLTGKRNLKKKRKIFKTVVMLSENQGFSKEQEAKK